jgi:hypothetical protein
MAEQAKTEMNSARRFVVQEHARKGQPVHWDLMLEAGHVLKVFRLDLRPADLAAAQKGFAVRIFDHDLKFLSYQGAVNNGQGTVQIADAGEYTTQTEYENRLELCLKGAILKGGMTLTRVKGRNWKWSFS